jgi:hypothetical protein
MFLGTPELVSKAVIPTLDALWKLWKWGPENLLMLDFIPESLLIWLEITTMQGQAEGHQARSWT